MDVLTREQRRFNMSRIRGKNTVPELLVRHLIHSKGYRYRLHRRELPGTPDMVFPGRHKVVFIHGCFWHRHRCRYGQIVPTTRRDFWVCKFQRNVQRDREVRRRLRVLGWKVLVIWECQTRPEKREWLEETVDRFLQ